MSQVGDPESVRAAVMSAAPFSIAGITFVPLNHGNVQVDIVVWPGTSPEHVNRIRCNVITAIERVKRFNMEFVVFVKEAE
jgi:hypothetical protein